MHVVWPSVSVTRCVHVQKRAPSRTSPSSFLLELFHFWLFHGFRAQAQLSLLHRSLANSFCEGPIVNISGFADDTVSVATFQLCCGTKATMDDI